MINSANATRGHAFVVFSGTPALWGAPDFLKLLGQNGLSRQLALTQGAVEKLGGIPLGADPKSGRIGQLIEAAEQETGHQVVLPSPTWKQQSSDLEPPPETTVVIVVGGVNSIRQLRHGGNDLALMMAHCAIGRNNRFHRQGSTSSRRVIAIGTTNIDQAMHGGLSKDLNWLRKHGVRSGYAGSHEEGTGGTMRFPFDRLMMVVGDELDFTPQIPASALTGAGVIDAKSVGRKRFDRLIDAGVARKNGVMKFVDYGPGKQLEAEGRGLA